jgi:ParB/RepB/Spo0J family partition protein
MIKLAQKPVTHAIMSLDSLRPSPRNARRSFDEAGLARLAASIAAVGLIEPVVVRPLDGNAFELICGERRWRAARLAGLTEIAAVVRDGLTDAEAHQLGLVENMQRATLDPIEEAEAFRVSVEEFGVQQKDLAAAIGRDPSYISSAIRLLRLPEPWRDWISAGKISRESARAALEAVDHPEAIKEITSQLARDVSSGSHRPSRAVRELAKFLVKIEPTKQGAPGDGNLDARALGYAEGERGAEAKRKRPAQNDRVPAAATLAAEQNQRVENQAVESATARPLAAGDLQARVDAWRAGWLRDLVATRLGEFPLVVTRLLLLVAARVGCGDADASARRALSASMGVAGEAAADAYCSRLETSAGQQLSDVALSFLRSLLVETGPGAPITDELVEVIAGQMRIDLGHEWQQFDPTAEGKRQRMAGRHTRAFLDLHDDDQLAELARTWGFQVRRRDREPLIDRILATTRPLVCRPEIRDVEPRHAMEGGASPFGTATDGRPRPIEISDCVGVGT